MKAGMGEYVAYVVDRVKYNKSRHTWWLVACGLSAW